METSWEPSLRLAAPYLPMRLMPLSPLDDDALFDLCQRNPDLRIERTAEGELLIMPPTGGDTGRRNASLGIDLGVWARRDGRGLTFDSSTGFVLPNGAERSADAAWVAKDRWTSLTAEQRRRFPPLAPDFVAELRSPSDRLEDAHAKMREWIENGVRLGWLVDPDARVVWLYRPGGVVERLDDPATISGEPVLAGFALDATTLW